MHRIHLPSTHHIRDLRRCDDSVNEVVGVEAGGGVFDADAAVGGVWIDKASVAVAGDYHEAGGMVEGCAAGFEG